MPVTPPMIRGSLYPTNLYARCPDFHACRRCQMCQNYNRHSAVCVRCEERKPAEHRHHTCTDDQQFAIIQFEERFGKPVFDINADPGTVEVAETAENAERTSIVRGLEAKELPNT